MKETPPLIPIPPGYVCISLSEYDNLHDRLANVKHDLYDEIHRRDKEIGNLHRFLEEKQDEIVMLHNQIEENKRTIETLRHQIFALSTVKEDLMADIRRRDDYLAFLGIKHLYIEWMEERAKEKDLEQEPIDFAISESRERE
jgi:predicted RNase H-like nuclease (RuvC/YqgF family)